EVDVKRDTHLHGVLAGGREFVRARGGLEGVEVRELPLGVVGELRLSHRGPEDLSVAESPARDLPAQLRVLLVAPRIGLLLIDHEYSDHATQLLPSSATRRSV